MWRKWFEQFWDHFISLKRILSQCSLELLNYYELECKEIFCFAFHKSFDSKVWRKGYKSKCCSSKSDFCHFVGFGCLAHQLLNACSYPVPSLHIEPQTVLLLQYSSKTQLNSSANLRSYQKNLIILYVIHSTDFYYWMYSYRNDTWNFQIM